MESLDHYSEPEYRELVNDDPSIPQESLPTPEMSEEAKLGLGLGVGAAVIVLIIAFYFGYRYSVKRIRFLQALQTSGQLKQDMSHIHDNYNGLILHQSSKLSYFYLRTPVSLAKKFQHSITSSLSSSSDTALFPFKNVNDQTNKESSSGSSTPPFATSKKASHSLDSKQYVESPSSKSSSVSPTGIISSRDKDPIIINHHYNNNTLNENDNDTFINIHHHHPFEDKFFIPSLSLDEFQKNILSPTSRSLTSPVMTKVIIRTPRSMNMDLEHKTGDSRNDSLAGSIESYANDEIFRRKSFNNNFIVHEIEVKPVPIVQDLS